MTLIRYFGDKDILKDRSVRMGIVVVTVCPAVAIGLENNIMSAEGYDDLQVSISFSRSKFES